MNHVDDNFNALVEKARAGDETAIVAIVRHYEPDVRCAARALLGAPLRHVLDSVDLVQSVHRSLMVHLRYGKLSVTSADHLCALAVTMVRRKVARQWRRARREGSLDENSPVGAHIVGRVCSQEPDPADAVAQADQLERVLGRFGETDRRLIELRLMGYSTTAAARAMGVSADVLLVRLSRLRQRLREQGALLAWV